MPLNSRALLLSILAVVHAAQPSAPSPIAAPLRPLPWGQLNFLHTTDTHGWHGGHLQEAQYSADWGDYISFSQHLKARADADGSDLLLVDTGDRVEGNGLYDASDPKGQYTFDIFTQQDIDIITPGNHELYLVNSSNNEYYKTVPAYQNNYLASNLDIYNPETDKREPLSARYRKFTTKNQGIRIIAFGFLFDFHGNANNTVVIPVEETIKQQWFQDAIHDREVDLFVVAGHVPVRDSLETKALYKAIRSVQWDTPIQFFGGHTHIRDYAVYDKASVGLESGRYMETIGFQSISGLSTPKTPAAKAGPSFERLYIDNNLFSLHSHSGYNASTFTTDLGENATKAITAARKELNLDKTYGCAPQTYWLSRAPYPSNDSLLTWLDQEVLPWIGENITTNNDKDVRPAIVLSNSGAMRFDIFKGPFTVDTTFLISPFTSGLRRLKDVPFEKANKILQLLNNHGPILIEDLVATSKDHLDLDTYSIDIAQQKMLHQLTPPLPPVRNPHYISDRLPSSPQPNSQYPLSLDPVSDTSDKDLIPGYTTHDDTSSTSPGDDTEHAPIKFYRTPNVVGANVRIDEAKPPQTVDLVYNEFIERWILLALRYLGEKRQGPGELLGEGRSLTTFLANWIEAHWECEE
ncbi:putative calcineurin-like phosphoesterase-2 [Elsinoe australis]|uniref:Putative calcineurin-like phosphoesterase-2 n=1 Tax=Elsinoe australis TaxID=40998 RepID=A0A4V6DUZ9_9PEZI|nr:putative calcineurin-like phosphoesterase-2 [Elsinoe australis]